MAIQISGCTVIDNSRNLVNTNIGGGVIINSTPSNFPLGVGVCGGTLICKASSLAWIASPFSAEISRNWYCRDDANKRAQQVSGETGWFVPICGQLQNPGWVCRYYWDAYNAIGCNITYWSGTENNVSSAWVIGMSNACTGTSGAIFSVDKGQLHCVRSFRCVTY